MQACVPHTLASLDLCAETQRGEAAHVFHTHWPLCICVLTQRGEAAHVAEFCKGRCVILSRPNEVGRAV